MTTKHEFIVHEPCKVVIEYPSHWQKKTSITCVSNEEPSNEITFVDVGYWSTAKPVVVKYRRLENHKPDKKEEEEKEGVSSFVEITEESTPSKEELIEEDLKDRPTEPQWYFYDLLRPYENHELHAVTIDRTRKLPPDHIKEIVVWADYLWEKTTKMFEKLEVLENFLGRDLQEELKNLSTSSKETIFFLQKYNLLKDKTSEGILLLGARGIYLSGQINYDWVEEDYVAFLLEDDCLLKKGPHRSQGKGAHINLFYEFGKNEKHDTTPFSYGPSKTFRRPLYREVLLLAATEQIDLWDTKK